ncbi:MAG TPA: GNAT family N-acetyltransferase [Anaerolineales bacterium]|jgi:ribosomal protein S18 acetylase RimI-like enzyme
MYPTIATISNSRGKISIRQAEPADAVPFSELRLQALHDNPTVFGSSYEARENCSPEWALDILSADPQQQASFVAESGGILLGMTSIRRNHKQKVRHSAGIAGVYVRPEWRGLGIVDALFKACFEWAQNQQVIIVKLAVVTTNPAAFHAYQRLGFSVFGTEPKVIYYDGVYYDEYLMSRNI